MAIERERTITDAERRDMIDALSLHTEGNEMLDWARENARILVVPVTLIASLMLWAAGRGMPFVLMLSMQVVVVGLGVVGYFHRVRRNLAAAAVEAGELKADIDDGRMLETRHEIVDVLVVRNPRVPAEEHLMAHTADDAIFRFPRDIDDERLRAPRRHLVEVRTFKSRDLVDQYFDGEAIDAGPARDFAAGFGLWLADGEEYEGTWGALREMLAP